MFDSKGGFLSSGAACCEGKTELLHAAAPDDGPRCRSWSTRRAEKKSVRRDSEVKRCKESHDSFPKFPKSLLFVAELQRG